MARLGRVPIAVPSRKYPALWDFNGRYQREGLSVGVMFMLDLVISEADASFASRVFIDGMTYYESSV